MIKSCLTSLWLGVVLVTLVVLNQFVFNLPDEPRPVGAFADVGSGIRMHYVERQGKDPAIVLIHGLPGTYADFNQVVTRLPGRHTIAIDRPGYGDSTGGTQGMFAQAESIHKLLVQRGVKRATVVGHSYGGPLAFALAYEHPADVGHIVTLAGAAGGVRPDWMQKFNAGLIGLTHLPVVEQINELFVSNMLLRGTARLQVKTAFSPDKVDPVYKTRVLTYTLKDSDLLALRDNTNDADADLKRVGALLGQIRQPTVVIQGLGDNLVAPKHARVIAREVPRAKLVMLSGGHMIPYTRPAEVVKQIRAVEALR